MTEQELKAIKGRLKLFVDQEVPPDGVVECYKEVTNLVGDMPALIAEVERLRGELMSRDEDEARECDRKVNYLHDWRMRH